MQIRDANGNLASLPSDGLFTLFEQGIYATSTPKNHSCPQIRVGVCGATLIHYARAQDKTSEKDVIADGEIGGFM